MKAAKSIDEFLYDFEPIGPRYEEKNRPVTIWLSVEDKARYEKLQKMSRKDFGRRVKEALIELIGAAERLAK